MIENKELKRRIIDISYKHKLSHLGSNLTAVDIIEEIYQQKKPDEKFILSSGHAGLALYTVLEKKGGKNAEEIFLHHGIHPDRCSDCGLDVSTGSLGQGLPIAVGIALADRSKNIYCLISDGECAEGSIYESFRVIREQNITNLVLRINFNGWGAYKETNYSDIIALTNILPLPPFDVVRMTSINDFPFLNDQGAHYHVMSEQEYNEAMEILK